MSEDDQLLRPPPEPALPRESRWPPRVIWGSVLLGILIRVVVLVAPPTPGMLWDHHEYVQWGVQMLQDGPFVVHTTPPPDVALWNPYERKVDHPTRDGQVSCNYPPLSMFVLYGQARLLRLLDDNMVSNTLTARGVFSSVSILCDFLVAAGCWAIVRRAAGRRSAALVFAAVALAPPLIIDSTHWCQTDSWVLVPLVWMIHAMMQRRWVVAGLLWGVALGIKPQATLMAPVWLAALLLYPGKRVLVAGLIGPILLFALGMPFVLGGGGWAWFQRSYLDNLLHSYPDTTLKAFNIWYVDLLLCENDDAGRALLGLSKDAWAKLLTGGTLLAFLALTVRSRQGAAGRSLLLLTAASLLICVILPTRVHERYIVMPLPFLIAAAGINRRLWWTVVPLLVAASFQITVLDWMRMGAHNWRYVEEKVQTEYEQMRETLTADELADYLPPDEMLLSIRPKYLADRWRHNDPIKEWSLTILELVSAGGCLILLAGDQWRTAETEDI